MRKRTKLTIGSLAVLLVSAPAALAVEPIRLTGSIAGFVRDTAGIPQMGATVLLFNQHERLVQRALTNERGIFGFGALPPDFYSVRVNLASFVPALKQKIAVQPGMQSLLYINMASLLSSIELVYAAPGQGALMSDDWKWTLKASSATRPVLRALPNQDSVSDPNRRQHTSAIFSETSGLVKVSAGDSNSPGDLSTQADLGTAFAVATSVFGRNQLEVSGNVGYASRTGSPAAGFRTTYRREGMSPELTITMRQIYLPSRAGVALMTGQDGAPALRTMSVAMSDHMQVLERVRLDYGLSLDSVSFLDHLNYFSPYAKLGYDLRTFGLVQVAWSSGAPSPELVNTHGAAGETHGDGAALARDLAALALLPRVSLRDGRAKVQRTQSMELGYEKRFGSTTANLSAFRETVTNGAITMYAPDDLFVTPDVLPDLSRHGNIFNVGNYERSGYSASVTQALGDKLEVGAAVGRAGVLNTDQQDLGAGTGDELRSHIHTSQRFWASARASATLPGTGTHVSGSYQWTDYGSIMPSHLYLTQRTYPEAGLNWHIRQPIPSFPGMPGRLEATADLRNMLAQGYLPVPTGDGRRVLLIQSPRAVRGGLSFIF